MADRRVMGVSVVHNLLHMPSLMPHVASEQPQESASNSTRVTYLAALLAPDARGPSQLPSLIVEDDVWLVDGFGDKMLQVVRSAERQARGRPFFISMYRPEWSSGNPLDVRARHQKESPLPPEGSPERPYHAELRPYSSCTQALYFSDGALRRRLAAYFQNHLATSPPGPLQDIPIHEFLNKSSMAADVVQFYPDRSLVQHTGASSAIFGGGRANRRFHRAIDFPFLEKYVVEDSAGDWWGEGRRAR